jgi:hypothetical protein
VLTAAWKFELELHGHQIFVQEKFVLTVCQQSVRAQTTPIAEEVWDAAWHEIGKMTRKLFMGFSKSRPWMLNTGDYMAAHRRSDRRRDDLGADFVNVLEVSHRLIALESLLQSYTGSGLQGGATRLGCTLFTFTAGSA